VEELMLHVLTIADVEYAIWLERDDDHYRMHLDNRSLPVSLDRVAGDACVLRIGDAQQEAVIAIDGDVVHIHLDGNTWTVRYTDPILRHVRHGGSSVEDIAQAPMPGVVITVHVAEGQAVARGDTLLVIESMKLETAIKAWRDGIVATLHIAPGQTFDRAAPLVTFAPESGS
jgi:acetyl/propionyl-CoA carboxylase alpha subunit